jgi:hypothetical protein
LVQTHIIELKRVMFHVSFVLPLFQNVPSPSLWMHLPQLRRGRLPELSSFHHEPCSLRKKASKTAAAQGTDIEFPAKDCIAAPLKDLPMSKSLQSSATGNPCNASSSSGVIITSRSKSYTAECRVSVRNDPHGFRWTPCEMLQKYPAVGKQFWTLLASATLSKSSMRAHLGTPNILGGGILDVYGE